MATIVPPPSKRLKTAASERTRAQQDVETLPENLGVTRVRFIENGKPIGAPVLIPVADSTTKNLGPLVNQIKGSDPSELIPYRFSYRAKHSAETGANTTEASTDVDILSDLYQSIFRPGLEGKENIIDLHVTPQAVFRVNPVSRCSSSIPGHGEAILATQFSPLSSSRMATGSGDNTARVWDCDTGTPLKTLKGHRSWVLVVSWSPDNSIIATGSMDNDVRLFDSQTGEAQGSPLKGHTKWLTALCFEPYHLQTLGRPRLASSSKDTTVRIWDVVSKRIETVLSGHKGSVSCVRWGGTGNIYTSSHDKTVKVWDANKGILILTLSNHAHWVNHLAISTDHVLRTAYHDHTGEIPESTAERVAKAKKRFDKAANVEGEIVERLVTASDDCTIYLWNSKSTKPIARLLGHQKQVNHVTFSPDGLYISSAGFDNHVRLWNARDGRFLFALRGHVAPVYQTCFSPDSRYLVSGSKDTTLKVWDIRTGRLKEDLPGHQDEVYSVDWSPQGDKVGSGGKDKAVRVWRH